MTPWPWMVGWARSALCFVQWEQETTQTSTKSKIWVSLRCMKWTRLSAKGCHLINLHESEVCKDLWTNRIKQRLSAGPPLPKQDKERLYDLYVKAIRCTCLGFNLPTVGASFPAMRTAMDSTSSWQKFAEHPIWSYHQKGKQIYYLYNELRSGDFSAIAGTGSFHKSCSSKKQMRYLLPVRMVSRQ